MECVDCEFVHILYYEYYKWGACILHCHSRSYLIFILHMEEPSTLSLLGAPSINNSSSFPPTAVPTV